MSVTFGSSVVDAEWGCSHQEAQIALIKENIKICFVKVSSLSDFAGKLTQVVLDTSWMTSLDKGTQRQYTYTVNETKNILVEIFEDAQKNNALNEEFGELMVSIGSARALENIFLHVKVPLAELWKPQAKQNEGFDFHTVCADELINFGEAKYSAKGNPHGLAITQADGFVDQEKHFRDRAHLKSLVKLGAIDKLDDDRFGVVAAFSLNSNNPELIFRNALSSAQAVLKTGKITNFYLVGVSTDV
jgi:hypothetical protein